MLLAPVLGLGSWVLQVVARLGRPGPPFSKNPQGTSYMHAPDHVLSRHAGGWRNRAAVVRGREGGRGLGREMRRDALRLGGIKDRHPSIGPGALGGPRRSGHPLPYHIITQHVCW